MTNLTKTLLKRSGSNLVSIAGYLSTAATFFPIISRIRSYLLPVTLSLIVVGVFKGALSVIQDSDTLRDNEMNRLRESNDQQTKALAASRDAEINALKSACDNEIARLRQLINQQDQHIARLSRKPYAEDLEGSARAILTKMGSGGRIVLINLLKKGSVEVGRAVTDELSMEAANNVLAIAMQGGIVQHHTERQGAMTWTYWVINQQYRPVLEHLLYE